MVIIIIIMLIIITIIVLTRIKDLGHRISQLSGDARETKFLLQQLSVILQRFNAVLFGENFLAAPDDPDM